MTDSGDAGPAGERLVVLVNGLPGAGKTTLARSLARRLGLPLFSKDVIKEAHADVLGAADPGTLAQADWNGMLGAAANETIWALLADAHGGAVLESVWPAGEARGRAAAGLARAGVTRPLQIWCEVPLETARARFERRQPGRHPVHGAGPGAAEWQRRWAVAEPLPIVPTLRVDTTRPVDVESVTRWIHEAGSMAAHDQGSVRIRDPRPT